MPIAPEDHPGAVRQSRRAALCLAAVAVLALAAFHAAPEQAGIGRFGFHLALALAGFAVTGLTIAASEGRSGSARLLVVWGRVAAWAVPAVAVVVAAVLMAGLALLPPADLRNQGWTALWTALGNSGAELLKQGAYTPRSSSELLMHGWLIGVTAQLAVGWSLFLVVTRRLGSARWIAVAAATALATSLALDLVMRRYGFHLAAFYLAPTRAWPFLVGALTALIAAGRNPARKRAPGLLEGLAWFGAAALPFYLWSWPLLAFPRLILARPLSVPEAVLALAAAALLALATHHWIEAPVRRRLAGRPVRALILAALALGAIGTGGAALYLLNGLPARASSAVRAEEAAALRRPPLQAACHTEGEALPAADQCMVPAGADADIVLWGNSHADHLSPAVMVWAEGRGLGVRQATRSGCLPLLRPREGLIDEGCLAFNRAAVVEWGRARPEVILLGAGWTLVLDQAPGDPAHNLDALTEELAHTMRVLRAAVGPRTLIVLLGTSPDYGFAPGACHARRAFLGKDTTRCDLALPANARSAVAVDARLAALAAADPGVALYRPWSVLCQDMGEGHHCLTRGLGGPWYSDARHMTAAGGARQAEALALVLNARFPRDP